MKEVAKARSEAQAKEKQMETMRETYKKELRS